MAILGRNMRFLGANPAFCEFLGYTEDELEGKDWAMVSDSPGREIWVRWPFIRHPILAATDAPCR